MAASRMGLKVSTGSAADMEEKGEKLCEAARVGDVAGITSLIDAAGDVTYFDADGLTPLMHAAKHGHTEAVRVQAELILGTIARKEKENGHSNECYLADRVSFSEDKLMDTDSKAVMMAWEKPLMEAHAKAVCSGGGHVLNIGFGMGLVDTAIQQYNPVSHTIIEAHQEVYDRMLQNGWGEKENVKILFGRWQDVLPQLDSYDGIFFDTYGEYYEDMREFHQHLPKLLKPGGIYSFFNGLCGDNAFFHVVYCNLVSLELENLGYTTQLIPLPVKNCLAEDVWEGVRQKYWQLDTYYLPVCQYTDDSV